MGLNKWRLSAVQIFVISSILTCIPQGLGALGLEISALYPTWGSVVNFVKKPEGLTSKDKWNKPSKAQKRQMRKTL